MVQEAAFIGNRANSKEQFYQSLKQSLDSNGCPQDIPKPNFSHIKEIYLKHVDEVFRRTLKIYPIKS